MLNLISDTFRFVKQNMMLTKNDKDNGKGDALWRTAISYIAYNDDNLKKGLLSCFRKFTMINRNKYWYQGSRYCDRYCEDDVSRDQTILALSALKINDDKEELDEIALHLPYKLSRRFSMGPTLWIWIRAITGKGKFYTYLFGILELIEFLPSVLWNKFIRKMMGWNKEYSREWYLGYNNDMPFWTKENGKWEWIDKGFHWVNNGHKLYNSHIKKKEERWLYRTLYAMEYPEYALHLTSLMIYVSDDTFLKKILQKLVLWSAEEDNLFIRKLMGKEIKKEDVEKFNPSDAYRWSTRFNGNSYTYPLKNEDSIYNVIDKDLLIFLIKKIK